MGLSSSLPWPPCAEPCWLSEPQPGDEDGADVASLPTYLPTLSRLVRLTRGSEVAPVSWAARDGGPVCPETLQGWWPAFHTVHPERSLGPQNFTALVFWVVRCASSQACPFWPTPESQCPGPAGEQPQAAFISRQRQMLCYSSALPSPVYLFIYCLC